MRALRRPESLFPLRLPLKQPSSSEMSDCFVEVRDWVQAWQACLCAPLLDAFPELDDWINRNPLKVLELADE